MKSEHHLLIDGFLKFVFREYAYYYGDYYICIPTETLLRLKLNGDNR